jgi:hypothetical protein
VGRENKFVLTHERASSGNSRSQDFAVPAIDFEKFAGATKDLLPNDGPEANGSWKVWRCVCQPDCFGPKRQQGRPIKSGGLPLQRPPMDNALLDFRP